MTEKLQRHSDLEMTHPGQVLKLDILEPANISVAKLAEAMGVSRSQVHRVIQTKNPASITADFAQRLELAVNVSADFWLRMQSAYDLWHARQNTPSVTRLIEPPRIAAVKQPIYTP